MAVILQQDQKNTKIYSMHKYQCCEY